MWHHEWDFQWRIPSPKLASRNSYVLESSMNSDMSHLLSHSIKLDYWLLLSQILIDNEERLGLPEPTHRYLCSTVRGKLRRFLPESLRFMPIRWILLGPFLLGCTLPNVGMFKPDTFFVGIIFILIAAAEFSSLSVCTVSSFCTGSLSYITPRCDGWELWSLLNLVIIRIIKWNESTRVTYQQLTTLIVSDLFLTY